MEICSRFTGMERKNGAFLLHTDNADVKVCFVTDEIVRVRASFDHELAEESYVLMTTAWEDRIKPLSDVALYRSTRIHHTPDSYTKRELVGAGPLHLAYARPFGRLKAPLGLSLLRCASQTRTCRGKAPPSCLRKTVLSLKSPTGAFIVPFRSTNAKLSNSVRCFALWHFYTLLNHTCNICNGIGAAVPSRIMMYCPSRSFSMASSMLEHS